MTTWKEAADFCRNTFGCHVNYKEKTFICPECGEPVYNDDWDDPNWVWDECPICGTPFEDM